MISGPDGNTEKTTDFDYVVHEWWDAKHTKKKYPVCITVTSKIRNLSLEVMVLKKTRPQIFWVLKYGSAMRM
ncbi:MAG: hypothetical protein R2874_03365 [Desulfobacterales bacterium]